MYVRHDHLIAVARRLSAATAFVATALCVALVTSPAQASEVPPATQATISAGALHSLVLRADGTVWAFGNNRFGQLGTTTNNSTDTPNPTPVQVMTDAKAVAGGNHSLVLKRDGTVWAFGSNQYGQLGTSTNSGTSSPNPTPTMVMTGAKAIAASDNHSLVLRNDGTVWAFGYNTSGQLGTTTNNGVTTPNPTPVQVMTDATAIAAGGFHSLVLRSDATVWSFGLNQYGQLGRTTNSGTSAPNPTPVQVMSNAAAISADSTISMVLGRDGSVWTFGRNFSGELGVAANYGTETPNPTPTKAATGAIAIAAGTNHSMFISSDGSVWAVGYNGRGQLGVTANVGGDTTTPAKVDRITTRAAAVSAGGNHSMVLTIDGTVLAFGHNQYGQIGIASNSGTATPNPTPTQVLTAGKLPWADIGASTIDTPARLLDTRLDHPTIDGRQAGSGKNPAANSLELAVTGRAGIPSDASAVVLNVTATEPDGDGYVTVYPCGQPIPAASSLNYVAGQTVANLVTSRLSSAGTVCIQTFTAAHLVVDVTAYAPRFSLLTPTDSPSRLLDTRPTHPTVDGLESGGGKSPANASYVLDVGGRAGIPSDASAVVLNVTATEPDADGYVTVYPCDQAVPTASNLNYGRGQTVANLVITKLSASGTVCLTSYAPTHLVADVTAYTPAGASLVPLPGGARLMDTRTGRSTIDGQYLGSGSGTAGSIRSVKVTGRAGVPTNATAVALNVTVDQPSGEGFVTVFPCGSNVPTASNINYASGQTVANLVYARPDSAGNVCLFTHTATHLIVDVTAYQAAS